jgi:hypothetical protein
MDVNASNVTLVHGQRGARRLIYSHDGGFTRHVVELLPDGYITRINETPCARRGTHDRMARLFGVDLCAMDCVTWREASRQL